jgi:hypothetical protein
MSNQEQEYKLHTLSETLEQLVEEDNRKDIIKEVFQEEVNPDTKCEEIKTKLEIAAKVESELEN